MNTVTDDISTMVERWVRHELPIINRGVDAHGDIRFLIVQFNLRLEAIAYAARGVRDPQAALKLLQLLAFGVSSVEHHLQLAGGAPGEGVLAMHATGTLEHLGEVAGHSPRDSHQTYWLCNQGDTPLTFTGSTQESMFIRIVNEMHHLHSVSAAALRPLCTGDVSVDSRMSVEAIEFAADNHERLTALFQSFLAPPPESPRSKLQFDLFAMTMRTYLCDYPVGMQTFPGPDLANMPGPMQIDLAIGAVDEAYRTTIRERMPLMTPRDRGTVEAAMQQPSLAVRLAEVAGLTENELLRMSGHRVAEHIALQPWLHRALDAYAHLTRAADASAAHLMFILDHLRPPASRGVPSLDTRTTLVQKLEDGQVSPVLRLRRSHPTVLRLLESMHA